MTLPKTKWAVGAISDGSCYLVSINATSSDGETGVWGMAGVLLSGGESYRQQEFRSPTWSKSQGGVR